jgi:hypothetical protein
MELNNFADINSCSAGERIPRFLKIPQSPPLDPVLRQMNTVNILALNFIIFV